MTRNLKQALFSALLVWAVAYPVLGLKLTIVGINLEVHNTSPAVLATIAICSVLMFLRVLFNQQISKAWRSSPGLPLIPAKARVRKLLALAGISGMLGEERQAELICWSNSTRRNISTEHTAMGIRVAVLVP